MKIFSTHKACLLFFLLMASSVSPEKTQQEAPPAISHGERNEPNLASPIQQVAAPVIGEKPPFAKPVGNQAQPSQPGYEQPGEPTFPEQNPNQALSGFNQPFSSVNQPLSGFNQPFSNFNQPFGSNTQQHNSVANLPFAESNGVSSEKTSVPRTIISLLLSLGLLLIML
ncbi:hypothetical protein SLA2020_310920 [Shorea laevis]